MCRQFCSIVSALAIPNEMDIAAQGPQYALHIAVHTLRERCKQLQQHVALLEEENIHLRSKCSQREDINRSINEVDRLRYQVKYWALDNLGFLVTTNICYRLLNYQNKKTSCKTK